MAEVTLVNPPLDEACRRLMPVPGIPIGLCQLAASLRLRGHKVALVDCQALDLDPQAGVEQILSLGSRYVGFTGNSLNIDSAAQMAGMCQAKGLKTILGGVHVTAKPTETMFNYPQFDLALMGEGDVRLPDLIEALERGKPIASVPGAVYRDNGNINEIPRGAFVRDLDELPLPAWDLLPDFAQYYQPPARWEIPRPSAILVTSRGCPLPCVFCNKSVFGRQRRFHSPRHIINMIRHLISEHGIKHIAFEDDTLVINKHHVEQLCRGLSESKLGITWSCRVKSDLLHPDLPAFMKRAGCCQVTMTHLSGSQRILDALNTKMTVEDIEEALGLLQKSGIKVLGQFVVGGFEESEETMRESASLIQQVPFDDVDIQFFNPLPGCEA
ncbi:MAG TPA: radical SAM protein, partial [bacterium]|nr:radical SAM protein [bacterium]